MVDNAKEVRKQILDVIGMIAAVVTIVAYVVLCINAQWQFIAADSFVLNVLKVIQTYAPLVVVALVGLEFVSTKGLVVKIVFYVAIALVVVCMFFPGTWSNLVGLVG